MASAASIIAFMTGPAAIAPVTSGGESGSTTAIATRGDDAGANATIHAVTNWLLMPLSAVPVFAATWSAGKNPTEPAVPEVTTSSMRGVIAAAVAWVVALNQGFNP